MSIRHLRSDPARHNICHMQQISPESDPFSHIYMPLSGNFSFPAEIPCRSHVLSSVPELSDSQTHHEAAVPPQISLLLSVWLPSEHSAHTTPVHTALLQMNSTSD